MTTSFLFRQAEAFDRSVDDLLTEDHEWAMLCRRVEEGIRVELALFDTFEELFADWCKAVARATAANADELRAIGERLREAYDRLSRAHVKFAGLIGRVEAKGYVVDRADEYRRRTPVPFDARRPDIPIAGEEVAAFVGTAAAGPKSPEGADDAADDDL